MMTNEEIMQIFFVECEESLAAAETGLAACKAGTHDTDTVNGIFRAIHSIKGGAGAFGFIDLQAYTHVFETLLSDVRDGTLSLTDPLVELLLRALDTLSDHVSVAQNEGEPPDDASLLAELTAAQAGSGENTSASDADNAADGGGSSDAGESSTGDDFDLDSMLDDIVGSLSSDDEAVESWQLHIRPHAGAMQNGSEPLLMLRELANLGGECVGSDASHVPTLDNLDLVQGYLGWTFSMPKSVDEETVREIFYFVGDDCTLSIGENAEMAPFHSVEAVPPAPIERETAKAVPAAASEPTKVPPTPPASTSLPKTSAASAAPAAAQSIRIDLLKLDQLIASVGELVIAQAMVAQCLAGEGGAASEELTLLEGLTRDIQENAMSIRAQPISAVFSRVPRILRELASSTDKHVKLVVTGETTELDKTVIDRLGEPLTHLIRNAVDHGIESAEDRLAAGKPAEGVLSLSAEHRSGRIHIRIADDGCGINRERVLSKAIEKGIVAPDAKPSNEEIDALIFAPGFSTAANVTNVSGRGVGMDVVRQNVKDLGGRITIESGKGKGTAFTLILPLTLAISDGMIVNVGNETLVVPLANVVESLRPSAGDVTKMGSAQHMLNVRGEFIPVLPVCQAIGASNCLVSPDKGVLIVVETEASGQAALLVDDICDQRQFVIKSLDTHYRAVDGISGATILGDGKVALILDVDTLVAKSLQSSERLAA